MVTLDALPVEGREPLGLITGLREPWRFILRRDICPYCGLRGTGDDLLTLDHVTPVSSDGENNHRNLVGCCRFCNALKGSRSVLHFLLDQVRLRSEKQPVFAAFRRAKETN